MPEISLIIPSWDAAKLLEKTLPAALSQEGVDYEVLVVDNGSPNRDSIALVERLAKSQKTPIRAIEIREQAGYAGAVNAGVLASDANYVAVLGNDNLPPPDWLQSLLREIKRPEKPAVGAVMSQTIVSGVLPPGPCTLNHLGRNIFYNDPGWEERTTKTFYPGGNSFLFERRVFGAPFEDFYFAYQEDVSFGWRVRLAGLVVAQIGSPRVPPLLLLDAVASLALGKDPWAKLNAWAWVIRNPSTLLRLRIRRQAERLVPDKVALREISLNYFSTAPRSRGLAYALKSSANFLVALYCRVLFIPGSRHS